MYKLRATAHTIARRIKASSMEPSQTHCLLLESLEDFTVNVPLHIVKAVQNIVLLFGSAWDKLVVASRCLSCLFNSRIEESASVR